MNKSIRNLLVEFAPAPKFEIKPLTPPFPAVEETKLEVLKKRLLIEKLATATEGGVTVALRRAANEAISAAELTSFPLLVFPALFEEKASEAVAAASEPRIFGRTRPLNAILA